MNPEQRGLLCEREYGLIWDELELDEELPQGDAEGALEVSAETEPALEPVNDAEKFVVVDDASAQAATSAGAVFTGGALPEGGESRGANFEVPVPSVRTSLRALLNATLSEDSCILPECGNTEPVVIACCRPHEREALRRGLLRARPTDGSSGLEARRDLDSTEGVIASRRVVGCRLSAGTSERSPPDLREQARAASSSMRLCCYLLDLYARERPGAESQPGAPLAAKEDDGPSSRGSSGEMVLSGPHLADTESPKDQVMGDRPQGKKPRQKT